MVVSEPEIITRVTKGGRIVRSTNMAETNESSDEDDEVSLIIFPIYYFRCLISNFYVSTFKGFELTRPYCEEFD